MLVALVVVFLAGLVEGCPRANGDEAPGITTLDDRDLVAASTELHKAGWYQGFDLGTPIQPSKGTLTCGVWENHEATEARARLEPTSWGPLQLTELQAPSAFIANLEPRLKSSGIAWQAGFTEEVASRAARRFAASIFCRPALVNRQGKLVKVLAQAVPADQWQAAVVFKGPRALVAVSAESEKFAAVVEVAIVSVDGRSKLAVVRFYTANKA